MTNALKTSKTAAVDLISLSTQLFIIINVQNISFYTC